MSGAAQPTAAGAAELPPISARELVGFIAMAFGMFMAILDIQIVSASLAQIQAGLSASADEISWVQTSYLIAEVVMIPLSGYLSRLLSTRVLFVVSAASFTLMSLFCALSTSIEEMIVFRALQGFLGGAMIPTVVAGSFIMFGQGRAASISVFVGLIATMAPTLGPTLGGALTSAFSWHWLFLINLPIGLVITVIVWAVVDIDKPNWSLLEGIDLLGFSLMAVFLGSLEYVLEEGSRKGWFEDGSIRTFSVVATVAGVAFFTRVLSARNPIVNLRVFKDRNFSLGAGFGFMLGIGLYGIVFLLPVFLARVRGYSSLQIGELVFVTGMFQFMASPFAGLLARRGYARGTLITGILLMAGSCIEFSRLTTDWSFWEMVVPQMMRGTGLMFCMVPANVIALGRLAPEMMKDASGLYNLMRNLGGALGLAVLNTQIIERSSFHYQRLAEHVSAGRGVAEGWVAGLGERYNSVIPGDGQLAALKTLTGFVHREAAVLAFADCFLIIAAIYLVALLATPLVTRPANVDVVEEP
jgi:DHA2 family multidrug resistance protein